MTLFLKKRVFYRCSWQTVKPSLLALKEALLILCGDKFLRGPVAAECRFYMALFDVCAVFGVGRMLQEPQETPASPQQSADTALAVSALCCGEDAVR